MRSARPTRRGRRSKRAHSAAMLAQLSPRMSGGRLIGRRALALRGRLAGRGDPRARGNSEDEMEQIGSAAAVVTDFKPVNEIFIVDDNDEYRELLAAILGLEGFQVTGFSEGVSFLK